MWQPIALAEIQQLLASDLRACSPTQREFFEAARLPPVKWQLSPWGDQGGGFWVVAVHRDRVLWYNDIEGGFNVSRFEVRGRILPEEYSCNQDPLRWALPRLRGDLGQGLGPLEPLGHG